MQQLLPAISINDGLGGAVEDDHWEAAVAALLLGAVAGLCFYLYINTRQPGFDINRAAKSIEASH